MIGNSWDDCLPKSHREALHNSLCLLVDDFLNDPDYDEPLFITSLPSKYLLQYDGGFRRKFLVILLTVGYKLSQPEPPVPFFSCTAEELGLHVLIEEAEEDLKTQGIEPEFSEFEDQAFQDDMDIRILYDMALDGVENSPVGDSMGYGNLQFDLWFEPFLNATTPVHPYAAEER
jgi:hypothetical protein